MADSQICIGHKTTSILCIRRGRRSKTPPPVSHPSVCYLSTSARLSPVQRAINQITKSSILNQEEKTAYLFVEFEGNVGQCVTSRES